MAIYGIAAHNGAHLALQEKNRQRQILDGSRAEPTTYDQSRRQTGQRTDHGRELSKKLEY
ncbi:hypothetical protein [Pseudomonas cedrina]|uniref:hypothetical protein n=1 Tax=Pseudomonas cedrina TaxID=651740 RepID=UPI00277FEB81|nr:hypothetical protein [Pseudomonas cedrina]MDQ0652492.1 hypothetical protein [Pseudomonas cedrina]